MIRERLILYLRFTFNTFTLCCFFCFFDESYVLIACDYVYLMFGFNKLTYEGENVTGLSSSTK